MDMQYYFITDNIHRGRVSVEYYPTEEMVGDFFTKPLQGSLFWRLRDQILNLVPSTSVPQECVGAPSGTWADVVKGTNRLGWVLSANDALTKVATSTKKKRQQ